MKEYFKDDLWGKTHKGPDPVIHFYEDFLKEYDPDLRKKKGALIIRLCQLCNLLCVRLILFLKRSLALPLVWRTPQKQKPASTKFKFLIHLWGQEHS